MIRELQWKMLDNYKRKLFLKFELKRLLLNSIMKNSNVLWTHRYYALYKKSKLVRLSSIIQHKNRCVRTGRRWSVVKLTKYSRFVFRNEMMNGHLPGFQRASW